MSRPIPVSLLAPLARPHLDGRGQARLADRDAFDVGLAWATREVNPNVALLQAAGTDSYEVYDYALDLISAQDKPIPDGSWAVIIANAKLNELVLIGYAAAFYKRADIATQAWRKAANCKNPDIAPRAAVILAGQLKDEGDAAGAKEAFQQAIDSGHAASAALASLDLGELLTDEGDTAGAKEAFQQAIDSGHAHAAPLARFRLGCLLMDEGDAAGAKEAFQQAIDSGHAASAGLASILLGHLLVVQGNTPEALQALDEGIHQLKRFRPEFGHLSSLARIANS